METPTNQLYPLFHHPQASLEYQNVTGGSNGSISGFVSVCREILSRFIQQHFPTKIEMQVSQARSALQEGS